MKKILAVFLCVISICAVFSACSGDSNSESTDGETVASEIETDEATITESQAVELIESFSDEELGLTSEERDECSFMVKSNGIAIDSVNYVNVIAAVKNEHEDEETGEITYTFDNKGDYYISYDGTEVLSKDLDTGEYTQLELSSEQKGETTTADE